MSNKIVLVVNDIRDCGASYYVPFEEFGTYSTDLNLLDESPDRVSLVVFTGGSDVSPSLYGHAVSSKCGYANKSRDQQEKEIFEKTKKINIPMAGICRGAQFLCAMNGGTIVQHLDHHNSSHKIITNDGVELMVNSIHHQLANPSNLVDSKKALVLAWSSPTLSERHVGYKNANDEETNLKLDREYEVVYYPESNSIGFQYHPEIMLKTSDGFNYAVDMCKKFLKI